MYETLVDVSKLHKKQRPLPPHPFKPAPEGLSLEELLAQKYYEEAVLKTTEILTEYSSKEVSKDYLPTIVDTWLARLQCLLLLKHGAQVADETVACLAGINAPEMAELNIPALWDLRLLTIPAFTKGVNQNTIHRLYQFSIDARSSLLEATSADDKALWSQRLRELGLYVAAALLSMKDYTTALLHLSDIYASESYTKSDHTLEVARIIALIHIQLGDTLTARQWIQKAGQNDSQVFTALCEFAEGDRAALSKVEAKDFATVVALSNIYAGDVAQAITLLEDEAVRSQGSPSTLYNLFVMYDLVNDDSRAQKTKISQRMLDEGTVSLGTYDSFK